MSVQPLENRSLPSSQLKLTEESYMLHSKAAEGDVHHVLQQSKGNGHISSIQFHFQQEL